MPNGLHTHAPWTHPPTSNQFDYERLSPLKKERDAAMSQKELAYQEYQERALNNLKAVLSPTPS